MTISYEVRRLASARVPGSAPVRCCTRWAPWWPGKKGQLRQHSDKPPQSVPLGGSPTEVTGCPPCLLRINAGMSTVTWKRAKCDLLD